MIQENVVETATTGKINLNEEQEQAANHVAGPCLVLACPGSGKTRVIVERTCRLVEQGISPRSILSITFTNKAAGEMKERTVKRIGTDAQQIYISTFHSLCANMLRKFGGTLGYGPNMTICDTDDQEALMAQVARQLGHELQRYDIGSLCENVNTLREEVIPESEWEKKMGEKNKAQFTPILKEFVSRLRANNSVDFSGLLSESLRLFDEDKTTLQKLQTRFNYIQVDEVQDTNYAQFKIFLTIGSHNNLFIVGDSDQSIYGWRGARYKNIQDFVDSKKAKIIVLPKNYRSTPEIVAAADRLIKHNKDRQHSFDFSTVNPSGDPVQSFVLPTQDLEGKWIASQVRDLIDEGYKPEHIAVLYRLNSMSRAIEQGLLNEGINYEVIGGMNFFDRMEIKDAIAMLKFYTNNNDSAALSRFINSPSRGIGEVSLGKIENFARENSITLVQALSRADEIFSGHAKIAMVQDCKKIAQVFSLKRGDTEDIGDTLYYLLNNLDYNKHLEAEKYKDSCADRKNNLAEVVTSSSEYAKRYGNDISAYLNQILLSTASDKKEQAGAVSLMTMHASKGLEFPVVFMPCLVQDSVPHKRAVMEREGGLEEERRLCYVGMTRAQKRLFLSYHAKVFTKKFTKTKFKSAGDYKDALPSPFLVEAGVLASCQKGQVAYGKL